jgi:hypothetical protein
MNYGSDNEAVAAFDEEYGLTLPSVSGQDGGGNEVSDLYLIASYPTVIVIAPDHQIVNQYVNPPSADNIIDAVVEAGGILVDVAENEQKTNSPVMVPNPVTNTGYLLFHAEKDVRFRYLIFDLTGQKLYESEGGQLGAGQQRIKLPVDKLNNGIYFVQLLIDEKTPETIRFIVAR